tara:strand:- start:649 stop:849 length:201 start_codon:yes stop_codon:yes gene_type:complete
MDSDRNNLILINSKKEKNKTTYKTIKKKDLFDLPKNDKSKNKVIAKIKQPKPKEKEKSEDTGIRFY